jgi:hypothetical protein
MSTPAAPQKTAFVIPRIGLSPSDRSRSRAMLKQDDVFVCKPWKRIGSHMWFHYQGSTVICGIPDDWNSTGDPNYVDKDKEFTVRIFFQIKGNERYYGTIKYV